MKRLIFPVLLFLISITAFAQKNTDDHKNEFGFQIGGEIVPSISAGTPPSKLNFTGSIAYQLNYARRIVQWNKVGIHIELPANASPSHRVTSTNTATPVSLATFFLTPSMRVNVKPQSSISPWLSVGGGYGLLEYSEKLRNGTDTGKLLFHSRALQWGGGLDFKTSIKFLLPIRFRIEARDFYTLNKPAYALTGIERQHNVVVSGGAFWKF